MEHLCVCLEMMSKHYRNYKHIKCNIQVRGFLVAPSHSTVTWKNTRGHILGRNDMTVPSVESPSQGQVPWGYIKLLIAERSYMTVLSVKSPSCGCVTRRHTYENLFDCPHCEKSFSGSSNLKRHELIHSGEKGYDCSQCRKSSSRSSTLSVHKISYIGEKLYDCPQCEKSFLRLCKQKTHLWESIWLPSLWEVLLRVH